MKKWLHSQSLDLPGANHGLLSVRRILAATLVAVIFWTLFIGLYFYNRDLSSRLLATTEKTLSEIVVQQKFNIDSEINAEVTALQNVALGIATLQDSADILAILNDMVKNTGFEYFIYADPTGHGSLQDGREIDISHRAYLAQVLQGQTVLSHPVKSIVRNTMTIPLATPVIREGRVDGVLVGSFLPQSLERLILPSFDRRAYSFVMDSQGNLILSTHTDLRADEYDNLLQVLGTAVFDEDHSHDQLVADISAGLPGKTKYSVDGLAHFAEYMPLQRNGWSIMVAVPSDVIANEAAAITRNTSLFMALVALCFGLLLLVILWLQRRNTHALERLAYYDEFSGAPTLAKFKLEAQRFMADNPGANLLMVKFDIKQFKLINQILGDRVGDEVIRALVRALAANTPGKYQRYARLHDDEFLVLHIYDQPQELLEIRNRFQDFFYQEMGPSFHYDVQMVSGHYYMASENCTDITQAIEKANIAHHKAKQSGEEICIYDQTFIQQLLGRQEIESRMGPALRRGEFKVYLQPKVALCSEEVVGAEALVRWVDAQGRITYPGDFIPLFEQNGFIVTLDFYMFEQTCLILRGWLDEERQPVPVSVNFSRLHLFDNEFVHTLCNIADRYGVPHSLLEVELTESIMFGKENVFLTVLHELHDHGFVLSMDDFGVGYSSLGLLKTLPVDVLKIDRSFFMDSLDKHREKSIIESIMLLAKKLGIHTVAEGVEEQEHIDLLREVGCDMVQGYYYAKPMPAEHF